MNDREGGSNGITPTVCFGVHMVGLTTASADHGLSGLVCMQRWRLRATVKCLAA
jgi:hypothetical protein